MRRVALLLAAGLATLVAPSPGAAARPVVWSVGLPADATVPVAAGRVFDLIGLHWTGGGAVELRARSAAGRWTDWLPASPSPDDAPDPGSGEARRTAGRSIGSPVWTGPSTALQVRSRGDVARLRAWLVRSPELMIPLRRTQVAGAPPVVSRQAWGADESIVRSRPVIAPGIHFAVVHHTAGANGYSRAEAPAIVRAIQRYHVVSNGWNDIGYNALVDRFGTVYEGRAGGLDRAVVGAHALGFNTGSVGVAVIGSFGSSPPPPVAVTSLARFLAWRLDAAHVDPVSALETVSGGSDRFAAGSAVLLRAVSGHRDTGHTACPGDALYARLSALASEVRRTGLPKLYEPRVTDTDGGVRFTARLSSARPWRVVVLDPGGGVAARGEGTGTAVDWTWDPASFAQARYRWRIESGPDVTPASGVIRSGGGTATLALQAVRVEPPTLTPNGDGVDDDAIVTYRLTVRASVRVEAVERASGAFLELVPARTQSPGDRSLVIEGAGIPDGVYDVAIVATGADGQEVVRTVTLGVTRTLVEGTASTAVFSPNGDGRGDRVDVRIRLRRAARVAVRILREGRWVATVLDVELRGGTRVARWDGSKRLGRARDGDYTVRVEVTDDVATASLELPVRVDTTPPRLRFLASPLRLVVGEPSRVLVAAGGRTSRFAVERPRVIRVPGGRGAAAARAVAWDAAGNTTVAVYRRR